MSCYTCRWHIKCFRNFFVVLMNCIASFSQRNKSRGNTRQIPRLLMGLNAVFLVITAWLLLYFPGSGIFVPSSMKQCGSQIRYIYSLMMITEVFPSWFDYLLHCNMAFTSHLFLLDCASCTGSTSRLLIEWMLMALPKTRVECSPAMSQPMFNEILRMATP